MSPTLFNLIGPRLPGKDLTRPRYVIPSVLLFVAAALMVASYLLPYWSMTLHAPQYPKGLHVHAYLNRLEGDVREIDGLNHYIGMRPLNEAAQFERRTSAMMITATALLVLAGIVIHSRWAALAALPAVLFPAGFLLDLYYWLNHFGQNLDRTAALSNSIKPFTPPVLGTGTIGQFKTVASAGPGWYVAVTAAGIVLVALYFHRRAYKPLFEQRRALARSASALSQMSGNGLPRGGLAIAETDGHITTNFSDHPNGALARETSGAGIDFRPRDRCGVASHRGGGRLTSIIVLVCTFICRSAFSQSFDLHAAIEAAKDGDVIVVPPGTYAGPIVVNKSIAIVAQAHDSVMTPLTADLQSGISDNARSGAARVILNGGGTGTVVRITAPHVTIRGLEIRGSGSTLDTEDSGIFCTAPAATIEDNVLDDVLFGLLLKGASDSIIRGNKIIGGGGGGKKIDVARRGDGIRLYQCANTLVEENNVTDTRDVVMWFSNNITLRRNHVSNSRYGMHFMYTDSNVLEDNVLQGNSVGAFLMYSKDLTVKRNVFAQSRGPSGYGLGLKDMDRVVAQDNVFVGNRIGVYLDNSPQAMNVTDDFTRNVFAYNEIGVAFLPSVKRNRFWDNSFIDNEQQVAVIGSGKLTGNEFTVENRGNYWSDYRGFDVDRNGVGDLPYTNASLFENLMGREPKLRLFIYSPAQQAIEMASRAFPIVAPQTHVTDDAPLMAAVAPSIAPLAKSSSTPMWLASALLGLVALGCLSASREVRHWAVGSRLWAMANALRRQAVDSRQPKVHLRRCVP